MLKFDNDNMDKSTTNVYISYANMINTTNEKQTSFFERKKKPISSLHCDHMVIPIIDWYYLLNK